MTSQHTKNYLSLQCRRSKSAKNSKNISRDSRPKGFNDLMAMDGRGSMVYYQNGVETAVGAINALTK
jgi:hypothetical protein